MTASRTALIALLLALLLRAGIPAGYMLAPGEGLPRVVPCAATAPNPHHRHRQGQGQADQAPCPFATVVHAGLPSAPPALGPVPAFFAPPFAPAVRSSLVRLPAALRPPATGPPSA